jgi:hypothetical protein
MEQDPWASVSRDVPAVSRDSPDYHTVKALVERDRERFESLLLQMTTLQDLLRETISQYTRNAWKIASTSR